MDIFLAHAGEDHTDVLESTQHTFEINPSFAVPLALAIIAVIPWLIHKFTHSTALAINVLLFELLTVGLLTYSVMPVLSVLAIVIGFLIALFVGLGGANEAGH